MPSARKHRVTLRRRKRGPRLGRGLSGYSSLGDVTRCRDRSLSLNIYSDGSTGSVIVAYGLTSPSNVAVIRPTSVAFFTEHVQNLAKLFTRWRLRGLELEIIPFNGASTASFTLGFSNDPAVSFASGPSSQQIASLEASRVFNVGSVSNKQSLRYIPPVSNEWKYVSEDSDTSVPSVRQCAAGELWGSWNISVPSTGRYADILVHFDVEFKDPVSNQNLSFVSKQKTDIGEKTSIPLIGTQSAGCQTGISLAPQAQVAAAIAAPTPMELGQLRLQRQSVVPFRC